MKVAGGHRKEYWRERSCLEREPRDFQIMPYEGVANNQCMLLKETEATRKKLSKKI